MLTNTIVFAGASAPISLVVEFNADGIVNAEISLSEPDLRGCDVVPTPKDWQQAWRDYWRGDVLALARLPVDESTFTPFRKTVTARLRNTKVPVTYAALAKAVGKEGASRAVGTVMSTNCIPLIIPCHRVIRSDGTLGAFSAPGGIVTKRKLLDFEATQQWSA